ncbi:MAG: hypothetical protein HN867_04550 [Deltaproteobacteria bacterium]|jgi:hypothetical protein|nr:hypothetical protein [Deltaproteobacteria bacterium]MBT7202748.1 hypothetical protein [Deltaproteobacteria bacterium]
MKPSLRLFCGVLLTAFTLSGCAEQILDSASKDPAPTVTSGEESAANTIAKFSTSEGLAPQPSDVVLASVNAALPPEGQLAGISRLMPIRIPFSRPLANLYNDNGSWNAQAGGNLALNLLIFPTSNPTALVLALPTVGGGTFKVVYQDANNDLVLVPNNSTFQAGTQYAVVVKTSLGDAQGSPLSPDILINILTNPLPIVVDGKIMNSLFDDLDTANSLEGLRASYAPLVGGLQALEQIESHNELAQLFTFTTEVEDPVKAAETATLSDAVQANLTTSELQDNITWTSAANLRGSSSLPSDQPENILSLVLASQNPAPPSDQVSALYKGYFSCQNFLSETSDKVWELDLINRAVAPGTDCPNSNSALDGKIGFWIAKPANVTGLVIFQHGITVYKETMLAIMNTLAGYGFATVAMDIWGHGERAYEDANENGDLSDDSGAAFIRPDNPALSVGYLLQTQFDLLRLRTLLEANTEMVTAIGNTPLTTPIHYVGMSLGGIIGSNLASSGFSASRFVLNVPGGDISDIVLSGSNGPLIRAAVASSLGIDTTTKEGQETLNSTMLGIDLSTTHALFKGGVDPLVGASTATPSEVLVQEVIGDVVVPNSNTELLSLAMGLTTYDDGDGSVTGVSRSRWIFGPGNYQGGTAGHGFLLDGATTATGQGQLQTACFLLTGNVLDPSKTIDPATCTNTN